MYNPKDVQFIGKHDFDALSARRYARFCEKSFSVNIFKWGLKNNGKEMKPLKCVVRVYGSPDNIENVFKFCENVVKDLDSGIWDGRKSVVVNWPQ